MFDTDSPSPVQQPTPSSVPTTTPLPWGVIGTNVFRQLPGGRGHGIVRERVPQHVPYHSPPLPGHALGWKSPGNDTYEMVLPGRPATAKVTHLRELGFRTLQDLRDSLAKLDRNLPDTPEANSTLLELDVFAARLLELVAHLHEQKWSLGLLSPAGILLNGAGRDLMIVLPDYGFEREPKAHRIPEWLVPTGSFVSAWAMLWDEGNPCDLQAVAPVDPPDPAETERRRRHDLRKVARLFCWLLLGRTTRRIPEPDDERDAYAPAWNVLDEATKDVFPSAVAFASALEANRLSDHFRPDKFAATPNAGLGGWLAPAVLALGGLAILVATLGAVAYSGSRYVASGVEPGEGGDGPTPPSLASVTEKPVLAKNSRVGEKAKAFEEANTLREKFDAYLWACGTRRSVDPQENDKELQTLGLMRRALASRIAKRLEELAAQAEAPLDVVDWLQSAEEVRDLLAHLEKTPPTIPDPESRKEVQECLELCRDMIARWRSARGA